MLLYGQRPLMRMQRLLSRRQRYCLLLQRLICLCYFVSIPEMQAKLRELMNARVVPAPCQEPEFLNPASTLGVDTDEDAAIAV